MAIRREYQVPLSKLSTFRIGTFAQQVVTVDTDEDLRVLFQDKDISNNWFVLGGGSNVVFPEHDVKTLIVRLAPSGIRIEQDFDHDVLLSAGGGDIWDDVVAFAVMNGFSGIESLSAIPGTAGATPVQNVGAYGTEIKDVLDSLEAFDVQTLKTVRFSNEDCQFGYRDSYFKHAGKGRYIITRIYLKLHKNSPDVPQYPGVDEFLRDKNISHPSLKDIREAITSIRWKKLPDPREIASVGSFFKNVFVTPEHASKLVEKFPGLKTFPGPVGTVKVPSGALLDLAGFKGKRFGNLSFYKNNALVVVNEGGATRKELVDLIQTVVKTLKAKFDVDIEPEPELLNI